MCPQSNVLDTARGNPSSYSRIPSLGAQRKQGGCPAAVRQHGHRGHCVGRSGGQSAASVAGPAQCRSPPLFFSAAALGSVSFSSCKATPPHCLFSIVTGPRQWLHKSEFSQVRGCGLRHAVSAAAVFYCLLICLILFLLPLWPKIFTNFFLAYDPSSPLSFASYLPLFLSLSLPPASETLIQSLHLNLTTVTFSLCLMLTAL